MKKWYALISAAFVLPLLAVLFISVFDTDPEVSASENRKLARLPKASLESILSGKFSEGFSDYYADTFPFRETLLAVGRQVNRFYSVSLGGGAYLPGPGENDWEHGQSAIDELDGTGTSEATTAAPGTGTTAPGTSAPGTEPPETLPPAPGLPALDWPLHISAKPWTNVEHPGGEGIAPGGTEVGSSAILIFGNAAMEQYYGSDVNLLPYAATLSKLKAALPDINVFALFCPTSVEFNAPAKYQSGTRSQLRAMNRAYSALENGVIPVDAWSELYAHRDEYLYFRTDHHWTQRGAYYAYRAFARASGFEPMELSAFAREEVSGFVGTMYSYTKNYPQSKVLQDNPDTVEIFRPSGDIGMTIYQNPQMTGGRSYPVILSPQSAEKLGTGSKYLVFIGGDNAVAHIKNSSVHNGRVLIVTKESYANALVPFLSEHFEEIFVIDPRYMNKDGEPGTAFNLVDFARERGATDILCVNYAFSASARFMNIFEKMLP